MVVIMTSFGSSGARLLMTQRKLYKNKMSFLEPFIDFPLCYYFSLGLPDPGLGDRSAAGLTCSLALMT